MEFNLRNVFIKMDKIEEIKEEIHKWILITIYLGLVCLHKNIFVAKIEVTKANIITTHQAISPFVEYELKGD